MSFGAEDPGSMVPSAVDRGSFPLAYSQLAHWRAYRLHERPAIRQIASAIRIHGSLDSTLLLDCVAHLIARHDALRTRITIADGVPVQVLSAVSCPIAMRDLTGLSQAVRRSEIERLIGKAMMEPLDPTVGPLSVVNLLKTGEDEHALIWAMEHMISDASSMSLLLTELLTAYSNRLAGRGTGLAEVRCQFPAYAKRQRQTEPHLIARRIQYWDELRSTPYSRFAGHKSLPSASARGWGRAPFRMDEELKAALVEWCRVRRTTAVMGMLTAFTAAVLRWCKTKATVVQSMIDGRDIPEVENTVGYFACPLFIPVSLSGTDTLVDLLEAVKQSYCRAYHNLDYWYLHALPDPPPFTRSPAFNWVPYGPGFVRLASRKQTDAVSVSPIEFAHPMLTTMDRDCDPCVLLYEGDREILGEVLFPTGRFAAEEMAQFAAALRSAASTLVREGSTAVAALRIPGS